MLHQALFLRNIGFCSSFRGLEIAFGKFAYQADKLCVRPWISLVHSGCFGSEVLGIQRVCDIPSVLYYHNYFCPEAIFKVSGQSWGYRQLSRAGAGGDIQDVRGSSAEADSWRKDKKREGQTHDLQPLKVNLRRRFRIVKG